MRPAPPAARGGTTRAAMVGRVRQLVSTATGRACGCVLADLCGIIAEQLQQRDLPPKQPGHITDASTLRAAVREGTGQGKVEMGGLVLQERRQKVQEPVQMEPARHGGDLAVVEIAVCEWGPGRA